MYMFPIYLSSSEACFHPLIESPKPVVSFMYHPICFFAYAESLFHIQLSDSFEQFPLIAHYFGSSILTGLHLLPIVLALLVLTLLSFFLSHCYCLPTRCLSFSPGFLACYNCLFSCRFFLPLLQCSFALSFHAVKPYQSPLFACFLKHQYAQQFYKLCSLQCSSHQWLLAPFLPPTRFLFLDLLYTFLPVPSVNLNFCII